MAGPRPLARSTKVIAPEGAPGKGTKRSKHQRKFSKKKQAPPATWDYDNSSGEESGDEEPAAAASNGAAFNPSSSALKKRPRTGGAESSAGAESHLSGDEDAGPRKASGAALARKRGGNDESGGSSGGQDEKDSQGSGDDTDGGGEEGDGGDGAGASGPDHSAAGGMGDVMARILGQKLDSRGQAPVLAKRKTKAMKEMENASAKRAESRGKTAAKRANMTKQFVIPDHTTTDYEKQLKKIATRGVVALFNAISKRQNQSDEGGGGGGDGGSGGSSVSKVAGKAAAVKGASRHAFLDMLKTGVKPVGGGAAAGAGGVGGKQAGEDGRGIAGNGARGEGDGGRSWSVLKEDYMMGASSMKNWDQESAESEEDALGGADDMSDDDSD